MYAAVIDLVGNQQRVLHVARGRTDAPRIASDVGPGNGIVKDAEGKSVAPAFSERAAWNEPSVATF